MKHDTYTNEKRRGRRRGVMRSGRETRRRAFAAMTTAILVATGFSLLLGIETVSVFMARAGVADSLATLCAVLLIGNGAMLMIPRWQFIATLVPLMLGFGLIVASLGMGSYVGALIGITAVASLGRIASWSRPRSIPKKPRAAAIGSSFGLDDGTSATGAA